MNQPFPHSPPSIEPLESRLLMAHNLDGLTPAQVRHAYGFDQISYTRRGHYQAADGSWQTIAIVSAFDAPTAWKDLQAFDKQWGLSDTDAYGKPVLSVATPQGKPKMDPGWQSETELDIEWAHAIAPKAHILLVETQSDFTDDLVAGVDYARQQPGVVVVSMSWGADGTLPDGANNSILTTPKRHIGGGGLRGGVTYVASSGDNGPFMSWPGSSGKVINVGGTSLTVSGNNYASETAWPSDISASLAHHSTTLTPTVAYNADPDTGYAVYDSTPDDTGTVGWSVIGGTSAGVPQWAALVAIADQGRQAQGKGSLYTEQAVPAVLAMPDSNFHDILTGGSNGIFAGPGTDVLTGRGSPFADRVINSLIAY